MSHRDRYQNKGAQRRTDSRRYNNPQGSRYQSGRRPHQRSPRAYIKKNAEIYILDILQHGGVDQAHHSWEPIAQIMVLPDFEIYEVTLNKNKISDVSMEEKYNFDIGRDALFIKVNKKLTQEQMTPASEKSLPQVINNYVLNQEERFVNFLNKVGPITIKRHYLEVLPGVGKKLMNEIISQRERNNFESYKEVYQRVPGFKPVEVITKRILEELEAEEIKHRLFVRKKKPTPPVQSHNQRSSYNNRKSSSTHRTYRRD